MIADALSRNPQKYCTEGTLLVELYIDAVQANWPVTLMKKNLLAQATQNDPVLRKVAEYVVSGWPRHQLAVPPEVLPYYHNRPELSIVDDLLTFGDRIVVPATLQADILERLHQSHQGLSKCRENAQHSVWWPSISHDIKDIVQNCMECRSARPSQRQEPLKPTELPGRPWQCIATDLFEISKRDYLVLVDTYSRWIEIKPLSSTKSSVVIDRLKGIFAAHGIPEDVHSDNGPQYTSAEFSDFAENYGFHHTTSSPHFH